MKSLDQSIAYLRSYITRHCKRRTARTFLKACLAHLEAWQVASEKCKDAIAAPPRSAICLKCDNYLPGHATGGNDICTCPADLPERIRDIDTSKPFPHNAGETVVSVNPFPVFNFAKADIEASKKFGNPKLQELADQIAGKLHKQHEAYIRAAITADALSDMANDDNASKLTADAVNDKRDAIALALYSAQRSMPTYVVSKEKWEEIQAACKPQWWEFKTAQPYATPTKPLTFESLRETCRRMKARWDYQMPVEQAALDLLHFSAGFVARQWPRCEHHRHFTSCNEMRFTSHGNLLLDWMRSLGNTDMVVDSCGNVHLSV